MPISMQVIFFFQTVGYRTGNLSFAKIQRKLELSPTGATIFFDHCYQYSCKWLPND
jgi:hypothetical protein